MRQKHPLANSPFRRFLALALLATLNPSLSAASVSTTRAAVSRFASSMACSAPTPEQIKAYKDAAAAVRSVLEKMNPAKADAESINAALKKITFDLEMVGQFERVADTLEAGVVKKGRFGPLQQATSDLNGKVEDLNKAYAPFKACEDDSTAPAAVTAVVDDNKALRSTIQEQLKVPGKLQDALKSIPDKIQQFVALAATRAQGAVPLAPTLAPQTLRSELAIALPDLAQALRIRREFTPIAQRITKALDPEAVPDIKGVITQKPTLNFAAVDDALKVALMKVPGWAAQAAQVARDQQAAAQKTLLKAMSDPFHYSNDALAAASIGENQRRDFSDLADAFLELLNDMQRQDIPETVLPADFIPDKARDLSDSTEQLQVMAARFARTVLELQDPQVDKSTWTMASVDLFYFDNVERLIRVLSPNARQIGGRTDVQGISKTSREELLQKSQVLEERSAEVSDARQKVAKLQERLRQATLKTRNATQTQRTEAADNRRLADDAEQRERLLTQRRKNLEARKTLASTRVDRAQAALDKKPDDPELQGRVESAKQEFDRVTVLADDAKADEERAHDEAIAARKEADKGTTDVDQEVTDLKAELTKAEKALETAETERETATKNQRAAMKDAFLAAQAENFAFAQARDNVPFWTNLPVSESRSSGSEDSAERRSRPFVDSDPLNRVLLFAFPDSRTIFVRGQRDDIDLVRQIIKEFDQPVGQAVMTLRTMEISSDGSKDSARRALRFLAAMDQQLIQAQSEVEHALSSLRDNINRQVKIAGDRYEQQLRARIDRLPENDPGRHLALVQLNRREENETLGFYDPRVLRALGWSPQFLAQAADTSFLNTVIPPPSQTVNLAQALIVLALANSTDRDEIASRLDKARFPSLANFLGLNGNNAEILGFQRLLVEALRFNAIPHVVEFATAKIRMQTMLNEQRDELRKQLSALGDSAEANEVRQSIVDINGPLAELNNNIQVISSWLQGNTSGVPPDFLVQRIRMSLAQTDDTAEILKQAVGLRRSARFRFSQASESAVNLTFRRYLEQVNRDLTEAYVKPAFRSLNDLLLREKLGVGVLQETSILASNRLVARVDPRGSAQLAVGEEKNVLEAAVQLTNLFGIAGKGLVTGATGNPLATAGSSGASSVLSTAQSVLGALDEMPREAPPAVYGISTGNLFQVTPVIDPSGQALRFRFDLVSATQVREPNDTIDPQLPRIERHSVNTEVQLADQEIRLISQFQANSRLGIAKRKFGGFPILKDLPGVSEVPLIGWFVKRGGRAAQTQQSLIFCQTTMYPTLSEVLDVSVRSPSFTGLETPN